MQTEELKRGRPGNEASVNSLLTIGDRHWRKVAATFKKGESTSVFAVHFSMGAYFCMGAYKHDVVVVIKMGAYTHEVLILCGCLLSRFYGSNIRCVQIPCFYC